MSALQVMVASQNPVKLQAVKNALTRLFPQRMWQVEGWAVDSGVADQPLSDAETLRGARQRARAVRQVAPQAHLWVGIEGGVQPGKRDLPWFAFAWIAILDLHGHEGLARTGSFPLPPPVVALLQRGLELGAADDQIFGAHNSKQDLGAVGLLSHGALDRTALYEQGVLLALLPYRNHGLYFGDLDSAAGSEISF